MLLIRLFVWLSGQFNKTMVALSLWNKLQQEKNRGQLPTSLKLFSLLTVGNDNAASPAFKFGNLANFSTTLHILETFSGGGVRSAAQW